MNTIFALVFLMCITNSVTLTTYHLSESKWKLINSNQSILLDAKVPGGVYSEITKSQNKYIFFRFNDRDLRWIGYENWTYFTEFILTENDLKYKFIHLVFDGVDTISQVFVNDKYVGSTINMFVRYKFNIKESVKAGTNKLFVNFTSPVAEGKRLASLLPYKIPAECWPPGYHGECHINKLRKMQASFAWDWGPAFPSVGIWKHVNIELSKLGENLISVGTFLTSESQFWRLTVRLWFDKGYDFNANITVSLEISNNYSIKTTRYNVSIQSPAYEVRSVILVPKDKVELWWPNGYGKPHLYKLIVNCATFNNEIIKVQFIGFRTIEIVQAPVSADPKQGRTFYFRVNNVPIFAKGSNWIPTDILPENLNNTEKITRLLKAAIDANFNMLRVWGGGVYESSLFYELCDEYGIMIWHDLMFACNMYPTAEGFLETVKTEIEQQVKRLQHHPSIVVWAGNNENEVALRQNWYGTGSNFSLYKDDYIKLYVETIRPIIEVLDPQRSYLESSPSNGDESIKEGYIANNPQNNLYGDVHYYNYVGNLWDSNIFPVPRFSSEYGVQSLPAYTTLLNAMNESDAVWESDVMQWKQHAPTKYLPILFQIQINLPQATTLKDIIYLSQINQAMSIKSETEHYRRMKSVSYKNGEGFTMGALYWQLNDVWEAPSWSSIDYLGNWKMLHYYAKSFFANIIITPMLLRDNRTYIFVVSDLLSPKLSATLFIDVYEWTSFTPTSRQKHEIIINPNESNIVLEGYLGSLLGTCSDAVNCLLLFSVYINNSSQQIVVPQNILFPVPLKKSNFPLAVVKIKTFELKSQTEGILTLSTDNIALFVWIECKGKRGEDGLQFSDNGFHMLQSSKSINVTSKNPLNHDTFLACLEITNLKPKYI